MERKKIEQIRGYVLHTAITFVFMVKTLCELISELNSNTQGVFTSLFFHILELHSN